MELPLAKKATAAQCVAGTDAIEKAANAAMAGVDMDLLSEFVARVAKGPRSGARGRLPLRGA